MATVSSSASAGAIIVEKYEMATCDSSPLIQAVAALDFSRSSSREETPCTQNSSSEAKTSGGTDSGYASASTTPVKETSQNSATSERPRTLHDVRCEDGHRLLWSRTSKITKAKIFDNPIPQLTQNRFQDLTELFSKHLIDYLAKEKVDIAATRNISIKLKCLGEDEATAKPCVVVLCNTAATKTVKKYFNRKSVKSQYQPHDPSPELPCLKVVVWDRPPRLIASIVVKYSAFMDKQPAVFPLSGTPIKVCHPDMTRFATLGGIVAVETLHGHISLYGLSAGHVVVQEKLENGSHDREIDDEMVFALDDDDDDDDDNSESRDGDDDVSDSESFELDMVWEQDHAGSATESIKESSTAMEGPHSPCLEMGHVWKSSHSSNKLHGRPNFDWTLIDIKSYLDQNSEVLDVVHDQRQIACYGGKDLQCDRPVTVFCGMSGHKEGTLSAKVSYLAIAPSEEFVKTYNLTLTDGAALQDGDCGSWVVDSDTDEVYGHVVAADDFGEAQVIPFQEIFRDIRLQFSAVSVRIPTPEDIRKLQRHPWHSIPQRDETLSSDMGLFLFEADDFRRYSTKEDPGLLKTYTECPTSPMDLLVIGFTDEVLHQSPPPSDSGYSSLQPSPAYSNHCSPTE